MDQPDQSELVHQTGRGITPPRRVPLSPGDEGEQAPLNPAVKTVEQGSNIRLHTGHDDWRTGKRTEQYGAGGTGTRWWSGRTPATLESLVAPIARRMRATTSAKDYDRWLGIEPDPRDLLRPFPAGLMRMWPISTRVNSPKNDDPDLLAPVEPGSSTSPIQGPNSA